MEWLKMGDYEYIRKINEEKFFVVFAIKEEEEFVLQEMFVDFEDFTEEEINDYLDDYFPSLSQMKRDFNNWKQEVAMIMAFQKEPNYKIDLCFDNEKELSNFLEKRYRIAN